jgi:hypothetical protein
MDSKIAKCDCGESIGVYTDKGFMIGNLTMIFFQANCPNCGSYLVFMDNSLVMLPHQSNEDGVINSL